MTADRLTRRMATLCVDGGVFSADDITERGAVTLDDDHQPNGRNNGIGSLFRSHASAGHIEPVGTKRSAAPHRKGGMIRTWQSTPAGQRWASSVLGARS